MGQKKFARINVGFFYKKLYVGFYQAAKKSGRNNEVAVRRGFTVTRIRDTNYRHALSNKPTHSVKHFKQFKI